MKQLVVIFFAVFLLTGCFITRKASQINTPPQELYETFLNLKLPSVVSDFGGEGVNALPVFSSKGYFTYKAGPDYFEMLKRHDVFIEKSDFNDKIHQIPCDDSKFPRDFSYWTEEKINIENKVCFIGVFFPYVHYIVYDQGTRQVHHFVTGMRD